MGGPGGGQCSTSKTRNYTLLPNCIIKAIYSLLYLITLNNCPDLVKVLYVYVYLSKYVALIIPVFFSFKDQF